MIGIYAITHVSTGRQYIGQSSDIKKRWRAHVLRLNAKSHHSPILQNAWDKYGPSAFSFLVLEICELAETDRIEQGYLDRLNPHFNIAKFARSRRGVPLSPEARSKISLALTGRKRSPAECLSLSLALTGKKHSEAAKAKMRMAALGRKPSMEALAKMSAAQKERPRPSSEYDSRRGIKRPADAVERSSSARRGAKRTPEQISRMKAAAAIMPKEKREKIAESRRAAFRNRKL